MPVSAALGLAMEMECALYGKISWVSCCGDSEKEEEIKNNNKMTAFKYCIQVQSGA